MSTVLFLSHAPREAHLGFANAIGARVKILPFERYIRATKTYPILGGYVYELLSLLYSLTIRVREDVLLVDGGSSLFTGAFLKKRHKNMKLIYLDAELLFYSLHKNHEPGYGKWKFILGTIDGAISVSVAHRKYISSFLDIPIQVCAPYPKKVQRDGTVRKNYGLYVGRLDPDKNIQKIIEFGLECPYFEKFVVVGDGSLKGYVEKMAKRNSKLVYVGWQENVEYYYNLCKFLVHIPEHDPHPTTTMEAVLCGCFPIISRGTGTRYLFDDIFIVDNPENYSAMERTVAYITSHEDEAKASLARSIARFPTKQSSLSAFKNSFFTILAQCQY